MPLAAPARAAVKFLPLVGRELRRAARGKAHYRLRATVVALGLCLMAALTLSLGAERVPAAMQGRNLFFTLVWVSAIYAFVAGLATAADSVSREKREGTLGLLFLTDLRGMDIILGKLAASSLNLVYGLLGLMPLLAIPVMLGGVSIQAGLVSMLGVLNLLFVSLALGIFVSTLSWDERRATFGAMIAGLALLLVPFVLGGLWVIAAGRGPFFTLLLAATSPLFPMASVMPGSANVLNWAPALGLLPSHLLGWLLLLVAGRVVERAWHSRSGSPVRRTIDERVFTPRDPRARAGARRRLLDVHPLVWLLERHLGKRFYADGLVFAIMAIWVWGYRTYGTDMFGGPTWFLIVPLAFTVHLILASWVVAEASMRLLEDRRTGALELLLCTALTDAELVGGHRLALRRLFLRPVVLLALAEVFVAFNGFGSDGDQASVNGRWMMLGMAAAVLLDTQALSWIALRLAVTLPTVNRVGALALAITPFGPVALTALGVLGWTLLRPGGEPPGFPAMVAVWIALVLATNLLVGQWWCRRWVRRSFRESVVRANPKAAL